MLHRVGNTIVYCLAGTRLLCPCEVKSKERNRIGSDLFNAFLNVSINGPESLSDEAAKAIAQTWLGAKDRRIVKPVEQKNYITTSPDFENTVFDDWLTDVFETAQFYSFVYPLFAARFAFTLFRFR